MKAAGLLISALIISINSFSQDLSGLYRNYLPKYIFESKSLSNSISEILNADAKLDPGLIYFDNIYCNNVYLNKITNINQNGLQILKNERLRAVVKRNKWAADQINILETRYKNNSFRGSAESYFEDLITDINPGYSLKEYEADTNKINYMAVIFYLNDPNIIYSDSVNYFLIRKEWEKKKKSSYVDVYRELKENFDIAPKKINDEMMDYWYVFDGKNEEISPADIIISYYENKYSFRRKDLPIYNIGVKYSSSYAHDKITIDIPDFSLKNDFGEGNHPINLFASVSYKRLYKDQITTFSYIDFSAIYSLSVMGSNNYKNQFKLLYIPDRNNIRTYLVYENDLSNFRLKYSLNNEVLLKASVPLLVLSPDIIFEGGITAGINIFTYQISYDKNYEKRSVVPNTVYGPTTTILDRQDYPGITYNNTKVRFIISPHIDFVYLAFNPLFIHISGGYNYLSLYTGYSI